MNLAFSLYNRDIIELNSFKETLYSFILNENFGDNYINIKEMVLSGF